MVFSVFDGIDPRKIIRTKIGTNHMIDGSMESCLSITDDNGDTLHVPMFLGEKVAVDCPAMPYVKLDLLAVKADPHNVRASVRKYNALISVDVSFNDMDNIDITSFGKKVADTLVNLIRTNQETTVGIYFYNVYNEGRIVYENTCDGVIFHWIMEITAENHDAC